MKTTNIKQLKSCPMCNKNKVLATYEGDARYKYTCSNCGQYFEFNAPTQLAADLIFNNVICADVNCTTEKIEGGG